jgi:hypothetical protein
MNSNTPSLADLEARLVKLERQDRRLKRLGLLFLLIAGSGFLLAQAARKPARAAPAPATPAVTYDTLVVHRLELRDKAGKLRGLWEVEDDIARLCLYDTTGKGRAVLAGIDDAPGLALYDAAGKQRAGLTVFGEGPALKLYDAARQRRASLRVDAEGPALLFSDTAGQPRAVLTEAGLSPR